MASSAPSTSASGLERFWVPPPSPRTARDVASIRASLSTFPSPSLRVSRVAQLDGALLDQELEGILGGPLWKALAGIKRRGRVSWEPEMMALLRIAVLRMSLWERSATYGSGLQNLKYRNEKMHQDNFHTTAIDYSLMPGQKSAYIVLEVLPSYLQSRVRDRMLAASWSDNPMPRTWLSLFDLRRRRRESDDPGLLADEWKRVIWEVLGFTERLGAIASLVNFLVFLYDGRYRTLVDRVLGMRLIYAKRAVSRNVSFEFLNRQLVWEAFTEFLLFLMPLINLHRLRVRASKLLSTTTIKSRILSSLLSALPASLSKTIGLKPASKPTTTPSSLNPNDETKPFTRPQGSLYFLPSTTCPICFSRSSAPPPTIQADAEDPSDPASLTAALASLNAGGTGGEDTTVRVPYVTDCGWECRYCYYCVVEQLAKCDEVGEDHWTCLRCGGGVTGVEKEHAVFVEATDVTTTISLEKTEDHDDNVHEPLEEEEEEEDEAEEGEELESDDFESVGSDAENS